MMFRASKGDQLRKGTVVTGSRHTLSKDHAANNLVHSKHNLSSSNGKRLVTQWRRSLRNTPKSRPFGGSLPYVIINRWRLVRISTFRSKSRKQRVSKKRYEANVRGACIWTSSAQSARYSIQAIMPTRSLKSAMYGGIGGGIEIDEKSALISGGIPRHRCYFP